MTSAGSDTETTAGSHDREMAADVIGQRPPQARPSPSKAGGSAFAQGPATAKKITNDEPQSFTVSRRSRLGSLTPPPDDHERRAPL